MKNNTKFKNSIFYSFIISFISIVSALFYSMTTNNIFFKVALLAGLFSVAKLFLLSKKITINNFEDQSSLFFITFLIIYPDKYKYLILFIIASLAINFLNINLIKIINNISIAILSINLAPGSKIINISLILFMGLLLGSVRARSIFKEITLVPTSYIILSGFILLFSIIREISLYSNTEYNYINPLLWLIIILLLSILVLIFTKYVQILFTFFTTVISLFIIIILVIITPYESFSEKLLNSNDNIKTIGMEEKKLNQLMVSEVGAGPRPQFNDLTFEYCDKVNSRDCFITYYDNLANKYGMKYALNDIVEKVRDNKGRTFATHCHQTVHNLGQLAFELSDGDFQLVSSYDPQVCGTGFIHGLYERYFNDYGKYIFSMTGEVCERMNLVQNWFSWTCNHILGHTIMTKMMNDPNSASEFCGQLIGINMNYKDCYAGAWMNFFADDNVINWFKENAMNKPEKVFNICYGAETNSKYWCYQEIFPILFTISNNNVEKMADWCSKYSEKPRGNGPIYADTALFFEERCIGGVARVLGVANGYDYRVLLERCFQINNSRQVDSCLAAGAATIVLNTGSVKAGLELCERVENYGYREYCYIWAKQTGTLLASGPNSDNMPKFGEIRTNDSEIDVKLPYKKSKI